MSILGWYNRFTDRYAVVLFIITVLMGNGGIMVLGKWHRDGDIAEIVFHIGAAVFILAIILTGFGVMGRYQQPKVKDEDQDQENP